MRIAKNLFPLIVVLVQSSLFAQQAKYTNVQLNEQIRIAGKLGKNVHIWSSAFAYNDRPVNNASINLHIFSEDMKLIADKKVMLGKSVVVNIAFQFTDSFYYANIIYFNHYNKRLTLRIDANGNIDDVTSIPNLWKGYNTNAPNSVARDIMNPGFISQNSTSFFGTNTETESAKKDTSLYKDVLFNGEKLKPEEEIQKISIRKVNKKSGKVLVEKFFASGYFNFLKPMLFASDSNIIYCAFADAKNIRHSPYNGNYLFLVKLDTNLSSLTNGPLLIKNSIINNKETYVPERFYNVGNKVLIISTGWSIMTNYNYSGRNNGILFPPLVYNTYVPSSLRITLADEKRNLSMDTIIKSKGGRESLRPENNYISVVNNEVYIFCIHRYTRTKNGITLFKVDRYGDVSEKEMIIDERYSYQLANALELEQGTLLIPYQYKSTTGIMQLNYHKPGE